MTETREYVSPDGAKIIGTLDMIPGVALISGISKRGEADNG